MAEIIANEGGGKKKGKRRAKKHSTHIDMTPMVDLACLLLTFFMLTTAFSKPKVMEIVLPDKDKDKKEEKQPEVDKDKVLNIILDGKDNVYWYNGMCDPNKPLPELYKTDFSKDGLRKVLLNRNKTLFTRITEFNDSIVTGKLVMPRDTVAKRIKQMRKTDKTGPVVLIKATDNAKYGNMVDVIDEMAIANIVVYAIVDINPYEKKMVAAKTGTPVADQTSTKQ